MSNGLRLCSSVKIICCLQTLHFTSVIFINFFLRLLTVMKQVMQIMHKVVMITSMMQEITDIAEISPVLNPPMLDFGVIMNSETKKKKKKQ